VGAASQWGRWGKWGRGGQSVGGVGGEGSPKGCRCARAPVAIRPFARENPPPRQVATAPRKSGEWGGLPSEGVPIARSGEGSRWPKASLGQVGLRWPVGPGPPGWPVGGQWGGRGSPKGGRPPSLASGGGGGHRWPVRGRLPVAAPPLRCGQWPVGA